MYIPYDRENKSRNNQQDMQNMILYFGVVLYHFYHDMGKKSSRSTITHLSSQCKEMVNNRKHFH